MFLHPHQVVSVYIVKLQHTYYLEFSSEMNTLISWPRCVYLGWVNNQEPVRIRNWILVNFSFITSCLTFIERCIIGEIDKLSVTAFQTHRIFVCTYNVQTTLVQQYKTVITAITQVNMASDDYLFCLLLFCSIYICLILLRVLSYLILHILQVSIGVTSLERILERKNAVFILLTRCKVEWNLYSEWKI